MICREEAAGAKPSSTLWFLTTENPLRTLFLSLFGFHPLRLLGHAKNDNVVLDSKSKTFFSIIRDTSLEIQNTDNPLQGIFIFLSV